jgi:vesicle-fusing ATPase
MKKNDLITPDVDLMKLAALTKNYTGAEIEAVCRSANSFALFKEDVIKGIEQKIQSKQKVTMEQKVCMADFMRALDEVRPAFGIDSK